MRISETMPSQLTLMDDFIAALLARIFPSPDDQNTVFSAKLALHEAVINAVKHGNKNQEHLSVRVDIQREENRLTMQVTDQGSGFDYQKIPDPILPENLEKLNGRGIFLIQNTMDRVEFSDNGRTIKMMKLLCKKGDENENISASDR